MVLCDSQLAAVNSVFYGHAISDHRPLYPMSGPSQTEPKHSKTPSFVRSQNWSFDFPGLDSTVTSRRKFTRILDLVSAPILLSVIGSCRQGGFVFDADSEVRLDSQVKIREYEYIRGN